MKLFKLATAATHKVLGPEAGRRIGKSLGQIIATTPEYRGYLEGRVGLEIGGPSGILGDEGALPVYDVLESLDNCLYSARTIWTGEVGEGPTFRYHPKKPAGKQFICEATALKCIASCSYGCLLASHCLEHVANPLLALSEWHRVLTENGILLLLLPHKDRTFDRRRPTTTLAHMISDFSSRIGEDDLTHLSEILALHDLGKDVAAGSMEQFRQRCVENYANRAMHHHVFDTLTALQVVDRAGFRIVRVDNFKPYHIVILASRSKGESDNSRVLAKGAGHWRRSPFPSDWVYV